MIRVVTGAAGEGKSKNLINMANDNIKTTKGHIVYLDGDGSHMYALKHEIRYINTSDFPLDNYSEFFGFLCGIISRDSDICDVYVDGLFKISKTTDSEISKQLAEKLKSLSQKFDINITLGIGINADKLPEELKEFEQIDL